MKRRLFSFLCTLTLFGALTTYGQSSFCENLKMTDDVWDPNVDTNAVVINFDTVPDPLDITHTIILQMDIFRPVRSSNKYPFILLAHAGGFSGGDRTNLDALCIEFAKRGFIAATFDYRLGWDQDSDGDNDNSSDEVSDPPVCQLSVGTPPKCCGDPASGFRELYRAVQDGHSAMAEIVRRQALATNDPNYLPIDMNKLYLGGRSAGAVLAMHMAFTTQGEFEDVWTTDFGRGPTNQPLHAATMEGLLTATSPPPYSFQGVMNGWGDITRLDFIDANQKAAVISFQSLHDETNPFSYGHPKGCDHYGYAYGSYQIHFLRLSQGICSRLFMDIEGKHGEAFEDYPNDPLRDPWLAKHTACFFKAVLCDPTDCANISFPTTQFSLDPADCSTCTSPCAGVYGACDRAGMDLIFPATCENDGSRVAQLRSVSAAEDAPQSWSLHPNPANTVLNVIAPANDGTARRLDIIDATGRVVRTLSMQAPAVTIDLGQLRNGVYLLRATTGDRVEFEQRFVRMD